MSEREARLVLADGAVFEGIAVGHQPESGVAAGGRTAAASANSSPGESGSASVATMRPR